MSVLFLWWRSGVQLTQCCGWGAAGWQDAVYLPAEGFHTLALGVSVKLLPVQRRKGHIQHICTVLPDSP